ncbi:MAG: hypothetical protein M0Q91_10085 [Methanoregula sp.]|jgi:hypothetical protein|nr:hypothetical protein [Methanoregula sp.]
MMQVEGKTYYQLKEAAEETGYTEGTIRSYISGGIAEAQKLPDGEWVLTEAGMISLRRRKKGSQPEPTPRLVTLEAPDPPTPEVKQPAHIVDVNKEVSKESAKSKKAAHPDGWKEGTVYIRTPEDHEKYNTLKQVADIMKIPLGDVVMIGVRYYADTVITPKLDELKRIEEQKRNLLMGITS